MSRKRRDKGRIPGQFVWVLFETLDTPAWRAMSPGARMLYIALKRRYSLERRNNGRIYLSTRDAAEELGVNKDTATVWFQELEHFGFIVKTVGGYLGVDGRGKAPHWRLTELGCMGDPPTKDYLSWKGERFQHPWKNRILSEESGQGVRRIRTVVSEESGHLTGKVSEGFGHTADIHCPKDSDISRITIWGGVGGALPEKQESAPNLPPMTVHAGGKVCAQCGGNGEPLFKFKNGRHPFWLHKRCRRYWLRRASS